MTHLDLFAGIGGFSLAAEAAGHTTIAYVEKDPFCLQILAHHFPDAQAFTDIHTADLAVLGRIDIITGGFPCQPFSVAGKRKGTADDRHLWPAMRDAIQTLRPRWVVGENVRGLVSLDSGMVFEQVCTDLEELGYKVIPCLLPACGVNAPHKRERLFIVAFNPAYPPGDGRDGTQDRQGIPQRDDHTPRGQDIPQQPAGLPGKGTPPAPNPQGQGTGGLPRKGIPQGPHGSHVIPGIERAILGHDCPYANPDSQRCQELHAAPLPNRPLRLDSQTNPADRPAGWTEFPHQSPVRMRDDGFPVPMDGITLPRWANATLKAYGNAVVPQVALQIFKTINRYEEQERPQLR